MIPIFTLKNFPILKPRLLTLCLCFAIFMPFAAQSQITKAELESRMNVLYEKARVLHDNLPTRDYRGHYLTLAVGISPFGHIKRWRIEDVCDCEGNVVGTQTVTSSKPPMAWTVGWENRLYNNVSFRLTGAFAHSSLGRGDNVIASNGELTQMKDNYQLKQTSLQGSLLWHIKRFYTGAGATRSQSKASGFQTQAEKPSINPSADKKAYYSLKADILKAQQTDIAPHFFVGMRFMTSPNASVGFELGVAQNVYANGQLLMTLSRKTKQSFKDWQKAYGEYFAVWQRAVAIDRELNPQKFQTNDDCTIIQSSSSSNCR